MNKIYNIVWSNVRQGWIVAHESAKRQGKPSSSRRGIISLLLSGLVANTAYAEPPTPNALPTGGHVTAGQATISQTSNTLNILQTTNKAAVNWNTFSIGASATVNFIQPDSTSITLNRVLGSDPSYIFGRLNANGQVFLVNPNGVLFGQGARVDVGGLVASTLNIKDSDFLSGNYQFSGNALGSVVNQGELFGHYIALLAPEVRNEGVIVASQGTVAMAGGTDITLNLVNNQLIDVMVNKADINTLVENKHLIQADEGTVILSAQSANHLLGKVVNSGDIQANGLTNDGGKVRITASSEIQHSGNIRVDAAENGNGGSAILIASLDNRNSLTLTNGSISARGGSVSGNGGFVETSASHLKIASAARIDTRAANGKVGQWLLDPYDFTIAAAGGDITGADLSNALNISSVTIQTTNTNATCTGGTIVCGAGNAAGNGDIFINDAINWTTPNSLTLDAFRDITFNESVTNVDTVFGLPGGGNIFINYGTGGTGKAVISQGVSWSIDSPNIVDNVVGHASTITAFGAVNTSRDFWVGTRGVDVSVQLIPGSGAYGTDATTAGFFASAGGSQINISSPTGIVTWDANPATLNVAGSPYALSYVSGLSSNSYSGFSAGNAANYTVTTRPITLAADNQTKNFGDVLNLGNTAFTLSSGTFAGAETISTVTLASVNGYDASTTQAAGTYTNEISISGPTGGGGFNTNNYNITFDAGDLTINPAVVVPPTPTPTPSPTSGDAVLTNTVQIIQSTPPVNQNITSDKNTGVSLPNINKGSTVQEIVNTACSSNCNLDATSTNQTSGDKSFTGRSAVINELVQAGSVVARAFVGAFGTLGQDQNSEEVKKIRRSLPTEEAQKNAQTVLNTVDTNTQKLVFILLEDEAKLTDANKNISAAQKDLDNKSKLLGTTDKEDKNSQQGVKDAEKAYTDNPTPANKLSLSLAKFKAKQDKDAARDAKLAVDEAVVVLSNAESAVVINQSKVEVSTSELQVAISKADEAKVAKTANDNAEASSDATKNSAAAVAAAAIVRERKAAVIAQLASLSATLNALALRQSDYGAQGSHVDAANNASQIASQALKKAESSDLDTLQKQLDAVKAAASNALATPEEYNTYNLGKSPNMFAAKNYLDTSNDLQLLLDPIVLNKIGSDAALVEAKDIVKDAKDSVSKAQVAIWFAEGAAAQAQKDADEATSNKAALQEIALKEADNLNLARAAKTRALAEQAAAESVLENAEAGSAAANLAVKKAQDALAENARANKVREEAFWKALADKAEADRIVAEDNAKKAQEVLAENTRLNKEREKETSKTIADKKATYASELATEAADAKDTATQAAKDRDIFVALTKDLEGKITLTAATETTDENARLVAENKYKASKAIFDGLAASAQTRLNNAITEIDAKAAFYAGSANQQVKNALAEANRTADFTTEKSAALFKATFEFLDAQNAARDSTSLESMAYNLIGGETPLSLHQKMVTKAGELEDARREYDAAKKESDAKAGLLAKANGNAQGAVGTVNEDAFTAANNAKNKIVDDLNAALEIYNNDIAALNTAGTKAVASKNAAAKTKLDKADADTNAKNFTQYATNSEEYANYVQTKANNAKTDAENALAKLEV